jgi:uncharacterized membrane protein
MLQMLLRFASVAVVGTGLFLFGCPSGRCENVTDCSAGQICVDGACVPRSGKDGGPDASVIDPDADASTPYYCDQIKPILDRTCVLTCHGVDRSDSLNQPFRLDLYVDADGGGGAAALAPRIKVRAFDLATMPPLDARPLPTDDERRLLSIWTKRGALFCSDGGI